MHKNLLKSLLKPVIRFCICNSIYFQDVCEIVKGLFIELAVVEINTHKKTSSQSKISVLTGITRREINRFANAKLEVRVQNPSMMARIIDKWQSEKKYQEEGGAPRILQADTKQSEFSELVHSVSQDLNPYTIRFELERLSLIESTSSGLKLLSNKFIVKDDAEQSFSILASDYQDLLLSVTENTFKNSTHKNLHLRTEFDNIRVSKVSEAKAWLLKEGTLFQDKVRNYLNNIDRDNGNHITEEAGVRISVGTYSAVEDGSSTINIHKLHNKEGEHE